MKIVTRVGQEIMEDMVIVAAELLEQLRTRFREIYPANRLIVAQPLAGPPVVSAEPRRRRQRRAIDVKRKDVGLNWTGVFIPRILGDAI